VNLPPGAIVNLDAVPPASTIPRSETPLHAEAR
jgi:hypothetical protein